MASPRKEKLKGMIEGMEESKAAHLDYYMSNMGPQGTYSKFGDVDEYELSGQENVPGYEQEHGKGGFDKDDRGMTAQAWAEHLVKAAEAILSLKV